ncbi:MAG: HU family DNA-binding protein [Bacteroidales bacterium]
MAIQYHVIEKENPLDRTAPKKFYANAIKRGFMGTDGIAERITEGSSANKADTLLVLHALSTQLRLLLAEGYSVKVDGLGTFRVTVSGKGADTLEEFGPHLIRKHSIRFYPEVDLKDKISRVPMERVLPRTGSGSDEEIPGQGE